MQLQCQMSVELVLIDQFQNKNAKQLRQEALDDHLISAQTQLLFFQLTDFGYEGKARQCRLLTLWFEFNSDFRWHSLLLIID